MFNENNKSANFAFLDIQQYICVIVMGNTYAFSIQSDYLCKLLLMIYYYFDLLYLEYCCVSSLH